MTLQNFKRKIQLLVIILFESPCIQTKEKLEVTIQNNMFNPLGNFELPSNLPHKQTIVTGNKKPILMLIYALLTFRFNETLLSPR